jgi:hypothetical protein
MNKRFHPAAKAMLCELGAAIRFVASDKKPLAQVSILSANLITAPIKLRNMLCRKVARHPYCPRKSIASWRLAISLTICPFLVYRSPIKAPADWGQGSSRAIRAAF